MILTVDPILLIRCRHRHSAEIETSPSQCLYNTPTVSCRKRIILLHFFRSRAPTHQKGLVDVSNNVSSCRHEISQPKHEKKPTAKDYNAHQGKRGQVRFCQSVGRIWLDASTCRHIAASIFFLLSNRRRVERLSFVFRLLRRRRFASSCHCKLPIMK